MEYLPSFRDGLTLSHEMTEEEFKAKKFGLPKLKKYPMPDAAHVRSAIKFFNYVTPSNEVELARAILARMEEYGISPDSMNIGDENRFKKYIENTELKHYGVLGMKWGVRRYQNPDGSLTEAGKRHQKREDKKYDKLAKKDAKEFARAKMFYGEGAGNRRKLIKNTVEQRRKDNEHYGEAFDKYLSEQDMAKHASAAKKERAVRTTKNNVTKTGRGLINASMGNIGRASASAAAIYTVAHMTGIDQQISQYMKQKLSSI